MYIYLVTEFTGIPTETEEMSPVWFREEDIPFEQMWKDDIYWFPHFLNNQLFTGLFKFRGQGEMLSHQVDVVEVLPVAPGISTEEAVSFDESHPTVLADQPEVQPSPDHINTTNEAKQSS